MLSSFLLISLQNVHSFKLTYIRLIDLKALNGSVMRRPELNVTMYPILVDLFDKNISL